MNKIKSILLFPNPERDTELACTKSIIQTAKTCGVSVFMHERFAAELSAFGIVLLPEEQLVAVMRVRIDDGRSHRIVSVRERGHRAEGKNAVHIIPLFPLFIIGY